jgi:hypothetical protein
LSRSRSYRRLTFGGSPTSSRSEIRPSSRARREQSVSSAWSRNLPRGALGRGGRSPSSLLAAAPPERQLAHYREARTGWRRTRRDLVHRARGRSVPVTSGRAPPRMGAGADDPLMPMPGEGNGAWPEAYCASPRLLPTHDCIPASPRGAFLSAPNPVQRLAPHPEAHARDSDRLSHACKRLATLGWSR